MKARSRQTPTVIKLNSTTSLATVKGVQAVKRADQLLVSSGLVQSRSLAQRLIATGSIWVRENATSSERVVVKVSELLASEAEFRIVDDREARFVSRSGLKLEAALHTFSISVAGKIVLDVGQSTGGFTDCLLRNDAKRVVGVDVGHDQLHHRLAADQRVLCLERINMRDDEQADWVLEQSLDWFRDFKRFDFAAVDVSFISSKLVLPNVIRMLEPQASLVLLFKPQFEVGKSNIGGGGIVKNAAVVKDFLAQQLLWFTQESMRVMAEPLLSPITGTDGNQEYLIWARKEEKR